MKVIERYEKHMGGCWLIFIGSIIFLYQVVLEPLYHRDGISGQLLITIGFYVSLFVMLIRIMRKLEEQHSRLQKHVMGWIQDTFRSPLGIKKWHCESVGIYLLQNCLDYGSSTRDYFFSKRLLCRILPCIFSSAQPERQPEKAENAFLNLLGLLEIYKFFILGSHEKMTESLDGFPVVINVEEPRDLQILLGRDIRSILLLMKAICLIKKNQFKGIDEKQLWDFLDNWRRILPPMYPSFESLPKSLNGREFAMQGYVDEGFKELFITFHNYMNHLFHRKKEAVRIGRRLIERRGVLLPQERKKGKPNMVSPVE